MRPVYTLSMKLALYLPFALLLGLIIGGWAPKEELRATRKQIAELSSKLAAREKDSRMDLFTRIARIPDRAQPKPRPNPTSVPNADRDVMPEADTNAVASNVTSNAAPAQPRHRGQQSPDRAPRPEDLRARIDEAKELWITRIEVARAQWIDRLKLSQDQTALFDEAILSMNTQLQATLQILSDELAVSDTLTPETGIRAFSEMTSILVATYDRIGSVLPEGEEGQTSTMELTDFIDPAITEPLISVQDKLQNLPHRQGPAARLGR
jgi:hypothetical protein